MNGESSKAAVMSHQSPLRKGQGGRFGFSGESCECKFGVQARDPNLQAWVRVSVASGVPFLVSGVPLRLTGLQL